MAQSDIDKAKAETYVKTVLGIVPAILGYANYVAAYTAGKLDERANPLVQAAAALPIAVTPVNTGLFNIDPSGRMVSSTGNAWEVWVRAGQLMVDVPSNDHAAEGWTKIKVQKI